MANNSKASLINLEGFKNIILSRFQNKANELDIKFNFINCDFSTQLNTHVDKLNQVITNLIENSIKYQKTEILTSSQDNSYVTLRSKCQSSQQNPQTKRLEQELNNKDSVLSNNMNDYCDYTTYKSILKGDQSVGNRYDVLNSSRNDANISALEIQQQHEFTPNKADININIELVKGENDFSNIFKISIQDKGQGMSHSNIIQILEIIANKNSVFNSDYQNYKFIGWKVNHQIIGKIGPFYSFYVNSELNHDIDILNQQQYNAQMKLFYNSEFQGYIQESNQNYYHVNNIETLRENIKQNKKNKKIRMKNNSSLYSLANRNSNLLANNQVRQSRNSSQKQYRESQKFYKTSSNTIEESENAISSNYLKNNNSNLIQNVQEALKVNQERFKGFQRYFQETTDEEYL